MHEFTPKDLALIVADGNPENVGKCVELSELVDPGRLYWSPVDDGYLRNNSGRQVWIVVGDVVSTYDDGTVKRGFCQKCPSRLMPLRGDFAPENEKSQEVPA